MTNQDTTATIELHVEGMHCSACAASVRRALAGVEGVADASVSHGDELARVTGTALPEDQLLEAVRKAGYTASVRAEQRSVAAQRTEIEHLQHTTAARWRRLLIIGAVGTVLIHAIQWLGPPLGLERGGVGPMWTIAAIATFVQIVVGSAFYRSAWSAARVRTTNMDTLIAIGATAAYVLSWVSLLGGENGVPLYFGESAALLTLISLGHWLEARTTSQAGSAVRELLSLQPDSVTRLDRESDRTGRVVPSEEIGEGELILLRPGERVAVDGIILDGESTLDESIVTGESMPVDRGPGDEVIAGAINLGGVLVVRTTVDGRHTTVARIAEMVRSAQMSRTEIQRLADRVSAVFVPAVLIIAGLTVLGWAIVGGGGGGDLVGGVIAATTVLVISCPCALGLATPTAIMVGSGEASRRGIFIKSAHALELLARVSAVFFDKTGTLTHGRPRVIDAADDVLELAAAVAAGSNHPLSRAIVEEAESRGLRYEPATNVHESAGVGITGTTSAGRVEIVGGERAQGVESDRAEDEPGGTVSAVIVDGERRGTIRFFDSPRPDAPATIEALHRNGITTSILSGDRAAAAEAVGEQVGIDPADVHAGLSPEEKVERVRAYQADGAVAAFVGDGINDAAALVAVSADGGVGIAMGAGSNVAIESADVVVPGEQRYAHGALLDIGRRTLATIKQNLFFSFVYNSLAIPAAALGLLGTSGPVIAAIAMAMSDLCVIGNSLRLKANLARERMRETRRRVPAD